MGLRILGDDLVYTTGPHIFRNSQKKIIAGNSAIGDFRKYVAFRDNEREKESFHIRLGRQFGRVRSRGRPANKSVTLRPVEK